MQGVNIVMKGVSGRTTISILECIIVSAQYNEIKLTSNNMQMAVETIIPGTVEEDGSIALDAKMLSEIVRKLPDESVRLETESNYNTNIISGSFKGDMVGRSAEEFPAIPKIEKNDYMEISRFVLRDLIHQTIFSVGDNENNIIMTGEKFELKDNILTVVSLDGHRISIRKEALKNQYKDQKVVIPAKTLGEIAKIIGGDEENSDIKIYFSDKQIMFIMDQTTIVSRLIEGEYLDTDRMISKDYETKVKINKKNLLDCIDRASIYSKEGDKKPLVMNIFDGKVVITTTSQYGKMEEDLQIEKEGKDLLIGFNPKFLSDALKVIEEEEVTLYMTNQKSPCLIKDDQGKYIYLILPINFSNIAR